MMQIFWQISNYFNCYHILANPYISNVPHYILPTLQHVEYFSLFCFLFYKKNFKKNDRDDNEVIKKHIVSPKV